jgi:hypothetical protein
LRRKRKKRINNNNNNNNNSKPQQKSKHRLQQVADYQPGDHLKQGTQTFIFFVGPAKGVKKSQAPQINKDSLPLSVLTFFGEISHLLVEQTSVYYQQHLDRQTGPSRPLPDIILPDMMTFIALALHMGHKLKDTLHD